MQNKKRKREITIQFHWHQKRDIYHLYISNLSTTVERLAHSFPTNIHAKYSYTTTENCPRCDNATTRSIRKSRGFRAAHGHACVYHARTLAHIIVQPRPSARIFRPFQCARCIARDQLIGVIEWYNNIFRVGNERMIFQLRCWDGRCCFGVSVWFRDIFSRLERLPWSM